MRGFFIFQRLLNLRFSLSALLISSLLVAAESSDDMNFGRSASDGDYALDLIEMPEIETLIASTQIDKLTDKYPIPPTLEDTSTTSSNDRAVPLPLSDAVSQALRANLDLRIAELLPRASEQEIRIARAAFDPTVSLAAEYDLIDESRVGNRVKEGNSMSARAGISEYLPIGATVKVDADWSDSFSKVNDPTKDTGGSNSVGGSASITQKLLKGRGLGINLIGVEQAKINYEISQFQLQDAVEDLLVKVEDTYWDLVLARQRIVIMRDALGIAAERLRETEEKINVGSLAPMEVAQSRADVAGTYTDLIAARNNYNQLKLELLAMLNADYSPRLSTQVAVEKMPVAPVVELDNIERHVALGLRKRPDINQAKLQLRRDDLSVKRTRNGLLPDLDLTISVAGGGGADRSASRWENTSDLVVGGGVKFSQPLGNREAKGEHRRAEITAEKAKIALENLQRQIAVNVRSNYLNVRRYEQQIVSTSLAATQYAIALQAMREKFRVGAATSLDVANAEYNYTDSRLRAAEAVINTIKQLTALYRADGSLLARRGVQINSR